MKQPLTERMASLHPQLDDCLRASVQWSRAQDPTVLWRAKVGSGTWTVRVNDFPEDHLYTIFVNDEEIGDFDEWPAGWLRTEADSNVNSMPLKARFRRHSRTKKQRLSS